MGVEITKEHFEDEDYAAFSERLRQSLLALEELLSVPNFGAGPHTLGCELELFLVDPHAAPLPLNRQIHAHSKDPRLTVELNRFNLELNLPPLDLQGRAFSALAHQLDDALESTRTSAAKWGGRIAMIGILPTLLEPHLGSWSLTDLCRYRALSSGTQAHKGAPFVIHLDGDEPLSVTFDDVTAEGANTSFQLHLRATPDEFPALYNAAQIATGPVLAASGNSPLFLGHRLWEETRIALFTQSVDDRPGHTPESWRPSRVSFGHGWIRRSALELFAESVAFHAPLLPVLGDEDPLARVQDGKVPSLSELRLHHGTVWRWNRGIYDPNDGGHLRIELRALPAGPTVADMTANAAFLLGLTLGIAPHIERYLTAMTFGHARRNFYTAAREGLAGELLWPSSKSPSPTPHPASTFVAELLPLAREGLVSAGVDPLEADTHLTVIERRLATGRTGARWQRKALSRLGHDRKQALHRLVEHYLAASDTGLPVHEWELPR